MYTVEIYEGNTLVEVFETQDKREISHLLDYYRMFFDSSYKYKILGEVQYVFFNQSDTSEIAVVIKES